MQINRNIALSDSGFIFNPTTGDSFSVNSVGLSIIRLMKDGKSKKEIVKSITEEYKTDEANVEKDFNDFSTILLNYQLVDHHG